MKTSMNQALDLLFNGWLLNHEQGVNNLQKNEIWNNFVIIRNFAGDPSGFDSTREQIHPQGSDLLRTLDTLFRAWLGSPCASEFISDEEREQIGLHYQNLRDSVMLRFFITEKLCN